ncbi:MAG: hypothetical protein ACK4SR_04675 [Thiobacillus sp.]
MNTRMRLVLVTLAAVPALFASGCASLGGERPARVTVPEIIALAREGVPADTIIAKMRASDTVYRLSASQLASLRDQGVPGPVIDAMQQTYLNAVRRDQRFEDWNRWTFDGGWWYGGGPYVWLGPWY